MNFFYFVDLLHCLLSKYTFIFSLDECINFLKNQCKEIGLTFDIYNIVPNKPIVFASWIGQQPELPSILLNSHMDVVPVYPVRVSDILYYIINLEI